MVAPVGVPKEEREPELITHRAHNGTGGDEHGYDSDGYDRGWSDEDEARFHEAGFDEDPEGDDGGKKAKKILTPEQRKKRRWRRIRRSLYAFVGIFFVLPAIAFAITYLLVDVPSPQEVAAQQGKVVTYFYADGKEMGRDIPADGGNRIHLEPHQVTDTVRHAVYAAEDATFETNSGFDITGIARAAYNQLTGGVGGGSTISQQYIKVATENDEYSYTRKWTELVKSFKMNNEQSKDQIITAYLNTIYFGRGAYGIETAAQAFFGKHAEELNSSESAALAGMIQAPGRSEDLENVQKRWSYVMDQMVNNRWITQQERDSATFPTPIPAEEAKPDSISGPDAYIEGRVKAELEAKGYPEEKVQSGGYKVYTTIDQRAQETAKRSVNEVMDGQPEELRKALVAVDPKTGGVLAYYGGPNEAGVDEVDWGNQQRNPGSSFKPFDLVALLQSGKGLGEVYDGSSPREFGNSTVRNSEDAQCPQCTVAEAMERSINTVFYDIVLNEVGVQAVVDAALSAGIPEDDGGNRPTMANADGNIAIGGGSTVVTPTDMAGAYATFAAGGTQRDTHFVSKLTTADGEVLFDETTPEAVQGEPAFSQDTEENKQIAGNVTESLEPVLTSSELTCADERDCAGKTGTHQYVDPEGNKSVNENAEAWMVGYNPQIATSVWVGTGYNKPIRNADGGLIYGSGLPGELWKTFMDSYLEEMPEAEFEEVEPIGRVPTPPETDDSTPTSEETTTTATTTTTEEPPSSSEEVPTSTEESTPTEDEETDTETDVPGLPTWPGNPGGDDNERWRQETEG
ncbi:penicillin-binding protein [Prauserella sp. ASG 168]|uniref:Penicillin-binding protein n=2 Tax=Prauserella cavernicola TaxID=2800127 RepID=A0A934QSK2_9PSEU|nr:penicillin-binding protein [Prauserella cavernicola]